MANFTYLKIPTSSQFRRDGSFNPSSPINSESDLVMRRIDTLLERYHGQRRTALATATLADIFLTCNYWIKIYHEAGHEKIAKHIANLENSRYPAVLALFEIAVNTLATLLKCDSVGPSMGRLRQVSAKVALIFGRDMHEHGFEIDCVDKAAKYLSKTEAEVYRIHFQGGLAYQHPWWIPNHPTPMTLMVAESRHAYVPLDRPTASNNVATASVNYGPFVMTLERELYMFKPGEGIFHSSMTSGNLVTTAGTMLIEQGKIRSIRPDSGHYKPSQMNVAFLLEALAMFGVDLSAVDILDFTGASVGKAGDFLKTKMRWDEFEKRQAEEIEHRKAAECRRQDFFIPMKSAGLRPKPYGASVHQ